MKMIRKTSWSAGALLLLASGSPLAASLDTIDWSGVPTTNLTLFYPGLSTYQWLRGPEHPGAKVVTAGGACVACHKGQEKKKGESLVKGGTGGKLEPVALPGKEGSKDVKVQVAYDAENAYFRFQWKTQNAYPGEAYPMYRFDGKEWKLYGGQRLMKKIAGGAETPIYEDRFSIMLDDGKVPGFATQGCWQTCHNGSRDTPTQPTADEVKAHPFYQAIKKNDVRKFLPATRTDANASWEKTVSVDQVAKLKAEGHFLELMQFRAHRSGPVGMSDDGYVLEWRNFDDGKNSFSSNLDAATKQPKFMYDQAKAGRKAFVIGDIRKTPTVLIREQNAVPFDPNAGWKEGDLLPQYVVSREDAKGSAADNKNVKGVWKDGAWTVTWARKLNLANPDDKALQEGKTYNVAFAVHDDNITSRGHQISFPITVGFGAKGAIEAKKLQ